jgi:demethylmenaquinone methyltransferase / 2-methoxy-6-polyprenyl-1,4-benzoquinol methylase
VAEAVSARNRLARELFAPLGPTYDRYARLLSFGQDARWRRFLVSRLSVGTGDVVLDVATGTGAVAIELVRARGCSVVAVDQSPEMLASARERLAREAIAGRLRLVQARAEELPFGDRSFDALTFTYLLRYVEDPASTLAELARVVRSGGTIASLEFGVPAGAWRPLWEAYVRIGLPLAGRVIGGGWNEVGRFLGPSIRAFYDRYPPAAQHGWWREAGIEDVRSRPLSVGGGVVTWGRRR